MFKLYRIAFSALSTLEIGATQLRSFTEIAPKLPVLMWTEALSGMAYVSAQKLSLYAFVLFSSHFFKVHALNEI